MPHEVQAHVPAISHALENAAQLGNRAVGDVRDAGFEPDRRHQVRELDRLELLGLDLACLDGIALLGIQIVRIMDPFHDRLVAGEMALDGLADRWLEQDLRLR